MGLSRRAKYFSLSTGIISRTVHPVSSFATPTELPAQSTYVVLSDLPLQQWLYDRASISLYTHVACFFDRSDFKAYFSFISQCLLPFVSKSILNALSSILIPSSGVKKEGASNLTWPYIIFLFRFAMPSTL